MSPAIAAKSLTKTFRAKIKRPGVKGSVQAVLRPEYREVEAVKAINLNIAPGELVGFIGPNGAGKSTTIKMLSGILWPSSGEVSVLGMNPQHQREDLSFRIGTVFGQRQQLWLHLPAIDTFNLFQHIYEVPEEVFKERLANLIELFEIEEFLQTPVRKLSLGQRMRCEFVAALLHKPAVLFLDEPTIGLDIIAKKKLRDHIRLINEREKTTIILTSHDLEDIEQLCPRVILINDGSILFDGPTKELRSHIDTKVVRVLFEEADQPLPALSGVEVVARTEYEAVLRVGKDAVHDSLRELLGNGAVADITVEEPRIEDVIEKFYR